MMTMINGRVTWDDIIPSVRGQQIAIVSQKKPDSERGGREREENRM